MVVTEQKNTKPDGSLEELRRALDTLAQWQNQQRRDVRKAIGAIAPLVSTELKHRERWDDLPAHDQAALYWALANGRRLSQITNRFGEPHHGDRMITDHCRDVTYFAAHCNGRCARWPEADPKRRRLTNRAVENLWIFEQLPDNWKAETLGALGQFDASHPSPKGRPSLLKALETSLYEWAGGKDQPDRRDGHDENRHLRLSTELVHRLTCLPHGWQVEAFRRIAAGTRPLNAISDAQHYLSVTRTFDA